MPITTEYDLADCAELDWTDLAALDSVRDRLLAALDADRATLDRLIENAPSAPSLRPLHEHDDMSPQRGQECLDRLRSPGILSRWATTVTSTDSHTL